MAHYVFSRNDRDDVDYGQIVCVAMAIDHTQSVDIARELTRGLQGSGDMKLGYEVIATAVEAYVPRSPVVGDTVSAKIALILPVGSIIICAADAWGPVADDTPLIRQGGGYVRVNDDGVEPTPLIDGRRYKILHIGKAEPNHHGEHHDHRTDHPDRRRPTVHPGHA